MSEENTTQAPGLVLPDDATMAERVSATDRLLSFDAGGNPVTATASQLREYTAAGLATTEAMTAALAGKQNTTSDPGAGYDLNNLHTTGTYNVINAQNAPVAGWIYVDVIKFTAGAGWVSQFVYTLGANNTANRMFHRNGINTSEWSPWVELWHTGNLPPATASSVGLMSAEDKIKLNSVASAMSLTVQTADTPVTLNETDAASSENAVTPGVSVRALRAAQYQMQADELLYDALEAFARNHPEHSEFAAWLEAKDRIRQQIPKPQEGGGE